MKNKLVRMLAVAVIFTGVLTLAGYARADETQDTVQALLDEGVPAATVDQLFSGPADTLGQRAENMLAQGTITQRQYDTLSNRFLSLPQERRWAIKNAYSKGYAQQISKGLTQGVHRKLNPKDDASIRDHAKDLRQQGYSRQDIKNRLINEGVNPAKVDALLNEEAGRREHLRELRDEGLSRDQARERVKDDLKSQQDRRQSIRDKEHERPGLRMGTKDTRDVRRGGADTRRPYSRPERRR